MTASSPDAASSSCPGCGAPLTGRDACPACGLRLVGPKAAQLWQVDVELAALEAQRAPLLRRRAQLLAELRGGAPALPAHRPAAPGAPRAEASSHSVQNTLLVLGALLLAVAAVVFTAVTYDRLGAGGRAGVLLVLTAAAAAAAPALLRRGLRASADTTTAVTLVLAALDAFGARSLGLGSGLSGSAYAACAVAVVTAFAAAYGRLVPVRLAHPVAVGLAQLPPLLLLDAASASDGVVALVLAALAVADLLVARRLPQRAAVVTALLCGAGAAALAVLFADFAAVDHEWLGVLDLLLLAGLAAAGSARLTGGARDLGSAVPTPLVALAAWSVVQPAAAAPLVVAAVGLAAALLASLLMARVPVLGGPGPLAGSALVALAAVAAQARPTAQALVRPVDWLTAPWTGQGVGARELLGPDEVWQGTAVTPLVVAVAGAALVVAAVGLVRRPGGRSAEPLPAVLLAALVVALAVLVPLGLSAPYVVAVAALVGTTAALLLARQPSATAAAAVTGLLACAWSVADQRTTLVVLPVAVCLATGASVLTRAAAAGSAAGLAGLLLGGATGATAVAAGLSGEHAGLVLVLVPAVLLALAGAWVGVRRTGLEAAAALVAVAAVALAAPEADALWPALAGLGVVALAGALRGDRRLLAPAGALLLAASSWVRLADAGVHAPEPYVVPLGLLALGLGALRRREVPSTGSTAAYGPGLTTLLLPSLLAAVREDGLTRPLLLGLAALVVLLAGVRGRLRAPLLLGGGVLAADALLLLAPYARALPRWAPLATAGLLLVVLGTTYEQRRRDLTALRHRYETLT